VALFNYLAERQPFIFVHLPRVRQSVGTTSASILVGQELEVPTDNLVCV